jgi:hypothetical protein
MIYSVFKSVSKSEKPFWAPNLYKKNGKKDERKETRGGLGGCAFCSPFPPVHQGTHHPRPPRPLLAALSQDSQHKTNMHQNELFLSEQMHSHSNTLHLQCNAAFPDRPLHNNAKEQAVQLHMCQNVSLHYAVLDIPIQRKV